MQLLSEGWTGDERAFLTLLEMTTGVGSEMLAWDKVCISVPDPGLFSIHLCNLVPQTHYVFHKWLQIGKISKRMDTARDLPSRVTVAKRDFSVAHTL